MPEYLAPNFNQKDFNEEKKVISSKLIGSIGELWRSGNSTDDILGKIKTWGILLEEIHVESQTLAGLKNLSNLDKTSTLHYQKILTSLFLKLKKLSLSEEAKNKSSDFYYILVIIRNALPIDHKPTQAELESLVLLGEHLKKHPSLIFKPIGLTLIILGSVLAVTMGIILGIGTVGIGTPLGILLAIGAASATVGALTGIAFFAHSTSHISQEVNDLTEVIKSHI